jgi:putative hydrolase of the HAD superfamily
VKEPATCEVLLFDLGGVLVDVPTRAEIEAALWPDSTTEAIAGYWANTTVWGDFERGLLTPDQFVEACIRAWELKLTPAEFMTTFRAWTRALLPGAAELLEELRPRYRLVALSNSNEVHWHRNDVELGVPALFETAFSSHLLGLRKPSREVYEHVLGELNVKAGEVIFFDDSPPNVEAAQAVGLRAYEVTSPAQVRSCLVDLGLLAPRS